MGFNEKYIEEFSNLNADDIYELCKDDIKISKTKFKKEMKKFIDLNDPLKNLSENNLQNISGGSLNKNYTKKGLSATLAMLTAIGAVPTPGKTLDFTPKAHAGLFSSFKLSVQDPTEMSEVIEYIRTDAYYKKQLAKYMGPQSNCLESTGEFAKWWNTDNNGKKWWNLPLEKNGGNISCQHAQTPAQQGVGKFDSFDYTSEERAKAREEHKKNMQKILDQLPELSAATGLLRYYVKLTADKNNIKSSIDVNNKTNSLFKSRELKETINKYFGTFTIDPKPGLLDMLLEGKKQNVEYRAFDYLLYLVATGDSPAQTWDNRMFFHNLKIAAPWVGAAAMGLILLLSANQVRTLFSSAGSFIQRIMLKAYNRFIYNRLKVEKDPVKLKELISEYLKSTVLRQDAAMDKITEIMSGMTDMWARSEATGEPCNSACTMVFMGDSGVGKTFTARMLSLALFHREMESWQFISAGAVLGASTTPNKNKSSKSKKDVPEVQENLTPADRIFNANSELIRQLKLNNKVIVLFDEIDKYNDSTILERLRDARDTGKLLVRDGVDYEYIDVSGTIFILTTNEKRECWGLPPEELTPAQAAARTFVERNISICNRFNIIEFKNFSSEDYIYFLRPDLEELKEEYSESHNIDFEVTDELVKAVSDAAEIKNKGVRGVNDYIVMLRGKLVDYRLKNRESLASEKNNVEINFNPQFETFNIERIESEG